MTQTEFHLSLNRRILSPHPSADLTRLDNTLPIPAITPAELENIIKRLKHKALELPPEIFQWAAEPIKLNFIKKGYIKQNY